MDFAGEVMRRIDELGLNINQAEARAGLPQGYIRGVVRDDDKRAVPNINKAETIAKALGLELYFGPPRTRPPEPPIIELDGDDFAAIPKLAVEASAGAGAINHDAPEVVGKLAFRRDWLRKIGVKPDRAMLVTVTGDSMAPELAPGDLALIDQDRATWEHNRVFALVDLDGGVRIKRILLDKGRALILLSDNPAHAPEARTGTDAARLRCLGRVVWSGHRWG